MKRIKSLAFRVAMVLSMAVVLSLSAFASGDSGSATVDISGVTDSLSSGLSGLVPTILTAVGALAAAGLAIFGAKFAVRVGMQMFKKVTNG